MRHIRLAYSIVTTLVRDRMQYPAGFFVELVALTARCGVLLLLYRYVASLQGGSVAGVAYASLAWSMFLYFIMLTFGLRYISKDIMKDVRSGAVETIFTKPVSYLAFRVWWKVGNGIYQFLILLLLGTAALVWYVGPPPMIATPYFFATLIATFIGGCLLELLVYIAVGLLAFWIEDIDPVRWVIDKAVMILGGSYFPVALFPSGMYLAALYSPFGASRFASHVVSPTLATPWTTLLTIELVWIGVCAGLVAILYHLARRRVSVNGG